MVKTERAKKHIDDLEIVMRTFLGTTPYEVRAERDPKTSQPVYTLIDCQDIPTPVSAIAGDAVQNLRSALDHLAYMLVFIGTKGVGIPTNKGGPFSHVYFPIYDCPDKYKKSRNSKVNGMSPAMKKAIDAFHPYKGGNDLFWAIDQLNNIDKHRLLIDPVAKAYIDLGAILDDESVDAFAGIPILSEWAGHPDLRLPPFAIRLRFHAVKKGDVFFTGSPHAKVHQDVASLFIISFSEPKILEGKAVYESLREMLYLVESVISGMTPYLR